MAVVVALALLALISTLKKEEEAEDEANRKAREAEDEANRKARDAAACARTNAASVSDANLSETNDSQNNNGNTMEQEDMQSKFTVCTRELMRKTLENMGCQPEDGQRGDLLFRWQGESFVMLFLACLVRIWDLPWLQVPLDSTDTPLLYRAANKANTTYGATVVIVENRETSYSEVSCRSDIVFMSELPGKEDIVERMLSSCFEAKQAFFTALRDLKEAPDPASPSPDTVWN